METHIVLIIPKLAPRFYEPPKLYLTLKVLFSYYYYSQSRVQVVGGMLAPSAERHPCSGVAVPGRGISHQDKVHMLVAKLVRGHRR